MSSPRPPCLEFETQVAGYSGELAFRSHSATNRLFAAERSGFRSVAIMGNSSRSCGGKLRRRCRRHFLPAPATDRPYAFGRQLTMRSIRPLCTRLSSAPKSSNRRAPSLCLRTAAPPVIDRAALPPLVSRAEELEPPLQDAGLPRRREPRPRDCDLRTHGVPRPDRQMEPPAVDPEQCHRTAVEHP